MSAGPRVFVSAGETSGDRILGDILGLLRHRFPDPELRGLGGPAAEACGLVPLFPLARTAFSGAWDVVRNAWFAVRMYRTAARELRRFRPHLVLLVDYPGLNLRLAALARNLDVPVLFVAPPQAWAYRDPARKLRRARRALQGCAVHVLFPFEKPWYREAAASVSVGHFLSAPAPHAPDGGAHALGPARNRASGPAPALIALCPGSRLPVLRRNLPVWLRLLRHAPSGSRYAVLVPSHLEGEARRLLAAFAQGSGRGSPPVEVRTDKAALFSEAAAALAFPGTVTLELALARIPTLVLAILDPLTLALGRRILGHSRLALPNLILKEDFFPEWAGTAPGPSAFGFQELLNRRDTMDGWEPRLEKLRQGIGDGGGAEAALRSCLDLLGPA